MCVGAWVSLWQPGSQNSRLGRVALWSLWLSGSCGTGCAGCYCPLIWLPFSQCSHSLAAVCSNFSRSFPLENGSYFAQEVLPPQSPQGWMTDWQVPKVSPRSSRWDQLHGGGWWFWACTLSGWSLTPAAATRLLAPFSPLSSVLLIIFVEFNKYSWEYLISRSCGPKSLPQFLLLGYLASGTLSPVATVVSSVLG